MPKVSVLLPVYNGMPYLPAALESLLAQDFTDFEVIAIDDGSSDDSGRYLDSCDDPRVRVVHQENHGLGATLNIGLALSTGEYVARQDQDDVSMTNRFACQVSYLDSNRRCGLLGTWATIWSEDNPTSRAIRHPTTNAELQVLGLFDARFVHSSVMARRSDIIGAGGYPTAPNRNPPEDFDLWSRMARRCEVANLPQTLLTYREVGTSMSREQADIIRTRGRAIGAENIASHLGGDPRSPVYSDLVAMTRWELDEVSPSARWRDLDRVLRLLSAKLTKDLPNDAALVARTVRGLRLQLGRAWFRRARRAGLTARPSHTGG